MESVEIVEVGPRDGLQNIAQFVPTDMKVELVRKLLSAGFGSIEVGSFTNPAAIPQMRDTDEVVVALGAPPGVQRLAVVPNLFGAQRAVAAGVDGISYAMSASESHNRNNVRRSIDQSFEELKCILSELAHGDNLRVRIGVSTAFHCPFEGFMDQRDVMKLIHRIVSLKEEVEIIVADTTGMASPQQVRQLFGSIKEDFGSRVSCNFHVHDTAGFGIANILEAFEVGIRSFDAAVGGLGGCPYAPGATGNVASEDVVYLFNRLGVKTGVNLEQLMLAVDFIASVPSIVPSSHLFAIPRERLLERISR